MWPSGHLQGTIKCEKAQIVTLVLTACTNRKRRPVSDGLHMRGLSRAGVPELAAAWASRLAASPARFPATQIYGGRGFQEAVAAAERLNARLLVVSAGLGLIDAFAEVPAYACTIVTDLEDSVSSRVEGAFTPVDWWSAITATTPFGMTLLDVVVEQEGLILAALSEAYIDMVSAAFLSLPENILLRTRFFTRAPTARLAPGLRPLIMPYDERLDGPDSPIPGTLADFAARALRHFADVIDDSDRGTAIEHAGAVSSALAGWRYPIKVSRARCDDEALLTLLRKHWDDQGGCSLQRVRHEFNIACEQGRYATLARIVRSERA